MRSKRERTRAHIIQSAIKIISEKGIEKCTTREIAQVSGVSNGLINHYIPKRNDLFTVVIQEIIEEAYLKIETPPASLNGLEKILFNCEVNARFFEERPDYAKCILLFYYYSSISEKHRDLNTQMINRAVSRFSLYWKQWLLENDKSPTPGELRLAGETFHNVLQSRIIKYFSMNHQKRNFLVTSLKRDIKKVAERLLVSHPSS